MLWFKTTIISNIFQVFLFSFIYGQITQISYYIILLGYNW